jgi:hypothetical protein
MPRYSHTENGYTMDVQDASDVAAYKRRLGPPDITDTWAVEEVGPDVGDNWVRGEGGWRAQPEPAVPALRLVEMAGKEFHAYCASILGTVNSNGPMAGMARMGIIVRAMRNAAPSDDGMIEISYQRYVAASGPNGKFVYADAPPLFQALAAASLCTAQEAAALAAQDNWPKR